MGQDSRKWDTRIRQIFIPVLGLTVPNVMGLYGPHGPSSPWYWAGSAWFVLLSYLIWSGNLQLARRWGRSTDWLKRPALRTAFIVTTSAIYTVPLSLLMLWLWYRVAAFSQPAWNAIWKATALCVAVDLFVKNTYETIYLIRQRAKDALAVEQLERAKILADLQALKSQIDPHFIFNSLNTLAGLTEDAPSRATEFVVALAEVYRYFSQIRDRELVSLDEEFQFVEKYVSVLRVRFGDAIQLTLPVRDVSGNIPPAAIQTLIENAVKHNRFSSAEPLRIEVERAVDSISVSNEKRPQSSAPASTGAGLRNLNDRCRLLLHREIEIDDKPGRFTVRTPIQLVHIPKAEEGLGTQRQ